MQINGIIQEITGQLDTTIETMASKFEVIDEITTENIAAMNTTVTTKLNGAHKEMEILRTKQDDIKKHIEEIMGKEKAIHTRLDQQERAI